MFSQKIWKLCFLNNLREKQGHKSTTRSFRSLTLVQLLKCKNAMNVQHSAFNSPRIWYLTDYFQDKFYEMKLKAVTESYYLLVKTFTCFSPTCLSVSFVKRPPINLWSEIDNLTVYRVFQKSFPLLNINNLANM